MSPEMLIITASGVEATAAGDPDGEGLANRARVVLTAGAALHDAATTSSASRSGRAFTYELTIAAGVGLRSIRACILRAGMKPL